MIYRRREGTADADLWCEQHVAEDSNCVTEDDESRDDDGKAMTIAAPAEREQPFCCRANESAGFCANGTKDQETPAHYCLHLESSAADEGKRPRDGFSAPTHKRLRKMDLRHGVSRALQCDLRRPHRLTVGTSKSPVKHIIKTMAGANHGGSHSDCYLYEVVMSFQPRRHDQVDREKISVSVSLCLPNLQQCCIFSKLIILPINVTIVRRSAPIHHGWPFRRCRRKMSADTSKCASDNIKGTCAFVAWAQLG